MIKRLFARGAIGGPEKEGKSGPKLADYASLGTVLVAGFALWLQSYTANAQQARVDRKESEATRLSSINDTLFKAKQAVDSYSFVRDAIIDYAYFQTHPKPDPKAPRYWYIDVRPDEKGFEERLRTEIGKRRQAFFKARSEFTSSAYGKVLFVPEEIQKQVDDLHQVLSNPVMNASPQEMDPDRAPDPMLKTLDELNRSFGQLLSASRRQFKAG